jgi:hypothetical protein
VLVSTGAANLDARTLIGQLEAIALQEQATPIPKQVRVWGWVGGWMCVCGYVWGGYVCAVRSSGSSRPSRCRSRPRPYPSRCVRVCVWVGGCVARVGVFRAWVEAGAVLLGTPIDR